MKFLKILVILYSFLNLIIPIQLLSQELQAEQIARMNANRAADRDVNKACWFGAGMTVIGAGIAVVWPSATPDPIAFSGKSPDYVRAYTNAYKSRVKKNQTVFSILGCATTLTVAGCALLMVELNQSCQDWNEESCTIFPKSCYSSNSSEEESSCITGPSCGVGSDENSCGTGSSGSSCGSGSEGG